MPDVQPAPHLLRHLDPDDHALNAVYITESFLLSDQCAKDRYGFVHAMGGMLKMYELIQEMANAVSQFECAYEHSPWSDLIGMDWESCCATYTSRVIAHVLEYDDWPDLHALLRQIALPSDGQHANG